MARHVAARHRPRLGILRSARTRALLSLGILLGLGTTGTLAYWTDEAVVSGGSFTTGTLDVRVGDPAVQNDPTDFSTTFALSNMVPGSSKDAVLRVTNAGTVAFTYTVSASATNSGAGADRLGSALRLTVYAGAVCTGTPLHGPVAPTALAVPSRGLAAAAAEQLCVRATLPVDAAQQLQNTSSVVTLTVAAVQAP